MFNINRVFYLLDCLDIEQKLFAEKIGVAATVVSKWNKGQLGSYTKYITEIVSFFDVTPEYFFEQGVFKNWDEIANNAEEVYLALRKKINSAFADPLADEDICLDAWLDKNMNYGAFGSADELKTIRWFSHRVVSVEIFKGTNTTRPLIEIVFKPDFQQQLDQWKIDNPPSKEPQIFTMEDLANDFLRRMKEPPEEAPVVSNLDTLSIETLTTLWNKLNPAGQAALLDYADTLVSSGKYAISMTQAAARGGGRIDVPEDTAKALLKNMKEDDADL